MSELTPSQVRLVRAAREAADAELDKAACSVALASEDTEALVLALAAKRVLGASHVRWEPESRTLTLGDPPHGVRDKLNAIAALIERPSFWWDAFVHGATALVLCDEPTIVSEIPKPLPEQLAWATFAAGVINVVLSDAGVPWFGDDVKAYVACVLHDAGYARAPSFLEHADEDLEGMLWDLGKALRGGEGEPPAVEHQRLLHDHVDEYVDARVKRCLDQLSRLTP